MKDSGKKSIIPKTVVSAPEKDTVGDLIEQLHKEPEAIPEEKPEEKQNSRKRPRAKIHHPEDGRFRCEKRA
mgnify:CR=1 FL=1